MGLGKNKLWNLLFFMLVAGYSLFLFFNFVTFSIGANQPQKCGTFPGIPAGNYFCRLETHPYWFIGALILVLAAWFYFKKNKQEDLKDPIGLVGYLLLGAILVSIVFAALEYLILGLATNTFVTAAAIVLSVAAAYLLVKSDRKKKHKKKVK